MPNEKAYLDIKEIKSGLFKKEVFIGIDICGKTDYGWFDKNNLKDKRLEVSVVGKDKDYSTIVLPQNLLENGHLISVPNSQLHYQEN